MKTWIIRGLLSENVIDGSVVADHYRYVGSEQGVRELVKQIEFERVSVQGYPAYVALEYWEEGHEITAVTYENGQFDYTPEGV